MPFYPYLNFGGNCREAFERYHEIFGGDLTILDSSAMPSDGPRPEGDANPVIHAALVFPDHLLMASDDWETESFGPVQGMYVNFSTPEIDEAKRVFDALADGGEVEMALEATFFSPAFGVLRDRFGTLWMISTDPT